MAGLVPNTKELEKKLSELNKTLERLAVSQETIVRQNGDIISILKEIRDKPTPVINNKPFWTEERLADAVSNIRTKWTSDKTPNQGIPTQAFTTPPDERRSSGSGTHETM
jgi:predicted metal-dependent phosphoesterase TrpH